MKKTLLAFAVLAFSSSVFAQTGTLTSGANRSTWTNSHSSGNATASGNGIAISESSGRQTAQALQYRQGGSGSYLYVDRVNVDFQAMTGPQDTIFGGARSDGQTSVTSMGTSFNKSTGNATAAGGTVGDATAIVTGYGTFKGQGIEGDASGRTIASSATDVGGVTSGNGTAVHGNSQAVTSSFSASAEAKRMLPYNSENASSTQTNNYAASSHNHWSSNVGNASGGQSHANIGQATSVANAATVNAPVANIANNVVQNVKPSL